MSLEKLREEGRQWVEVNKSKRFSGVTKLLTDFYPDNAHFIYELLQNAEDAHEQGVYGSTGASYVRFELKKDCLVFEHNGDRLFTLKDVESITGIGDSSKLDDTTSIGKFGIGFKSVFSYTNTPEIHSGDYHFKIHDLVVPETTGVEILNLGNKLTRFIFPFNNPKKSAEQAVIEIEKGLRSLEDNTLLFLSYIRKIDYHLPDGTSGSLERIDLDKQHIEIRTTHQNQSDAISHWLRFEKDVEVADENGELKNCRIAVAFSMVEEVEKKNDKPKWKIVPLNRGQVSIYFPAEKETSNLRFHLHAPFASTVARASVRACSENIALRDRLKELIVESIIEIRDLGMLTITFLAVMPNQNDNIPELYEPIREAIVEAFIDMPLMPTRNGTHAKSNSLFLGPSKIADVLGDEGLAILTGRNPPLWAANPPPQHQRVEHFLESLYINGWEWGNLVCSFEYYNFSGYKQERQNRFETWVESLKDSKLMRLYALLGEAYCLRTLNPSQPHRLLKFIRVTSADGEEHVTAQESFLNPVEGISPPPGTRYVKPDVYNAGRSDELKRYAKMFLEHVGIRPFDEKEAILHRISFYSEPPARPPKGYLKDVANFVELYFQDHKEGNKLKEVSFLRGISEDGVVSWRKPYELYIDLPYMDTALDALFSDKNIEFETKKYRLIEDYNKITKFSDFACAIGVMCALEIRSHLATEMQGRIFKKSGRTTGTTTDIDYFMNGLYSTVSMWRNTGSNYFLGGIYLEKKSIAISSAVWKTMCRAKPEHLEAHYIPNARNRYDEKRGYSILIQQLRLAHWIPTRSGGFSKPSDMTEEELHPCLKWDNRNGWLTAVGFGENAKKRSDEYKSRNKAAQELSFNSAEEAEEAANIIREIGLDALKKLYTKNKKPDLPEGAVNNPERRRKRMRDDSANAPDKESILRERLVQPWINEDIGKAKAYLRSLYINHDDELVCQCCHQNMPFKVGDLHYFEAVQCIKDLKKRCIENRLALCPNCAALYQYAPTTNGTEIRNTIVNLEAPETSLSVEIPVKLAGNEYKLHFVGRHWFDLKTILETEAN